MATRSGKMSLSLGQEMAGQLLGHALLNLYSSTTFMLKPAKASIAMGRVHFFYSSFELVSAEILKINFSG